MADDWTKRFANMASDLQREIDTAGMGDPIKRERDELRAEKDRYRAALEKIADSRDTKDSSDEEIIDVLLPVQDLRRENRELRAENEYLKIAEQRRTEEVQTAMAEVVRLKAAVTELGVAHVQAQTVSSDSAQRAR